MNNLYVVVSVALAVFLFSIGECQDPKSVKTIICSNKYKLTILPNRFGDKTQDEAIFNMHTFSPLLNTFCADQLSAFVCSVFLPKADSVESRDATRPCRSWCQAMFDNCTYAMNQLNFEWPKEIACEKFPTVRCYDSRTENPGNKQSVTTPAPGVGCSATIKQPICSNIRYSTDRTKDYFAQVNQPFTNYFNHISQEQAVFELSMKYGMLTNLIVAFQNSPLNKEELGVQTCLERLVYLLCTLYMPRCGERKTEEYGITRSECAATLGRSCSSLIVILKKMGYDIEWPPVSINCSAFSNGRRNVSHTVLPITFQGLLPPPPFVTLAENGPGFLKITWKELTRDILRDSGVKTGLLYKVTGSKMPYSHKDYEKADRSALLDNLKLGTSYDVLVGSVKQNNTLIPGGFVRLQVNTTIVHRVSTQPFCSAYSNFTVFPNAFGDVNKKDAIFRMHTFFPLYDTMCSKDLKAFMCSVFLPPFNSRFKDPQKPCKALCGAVFERCKYAIERLKFKWPEELQCNKFPSEVCFNPSGKPQVPALKSEQCTATKEQSICSLVVTTNQPYFSTVKKNFTNYFNHTSQEQAVYELSKHATLLNLLTFFRTDLRAGSTDDATGCIHNITFLLCTLYLPSCQGETYQVTKSECEVATNDQLGGRCWSTLTNIREIDYSVKWPPVLVDCNVFTSNDLDRSYNFKPITFNTSIPPPDAVRYTAVNSSTSTWKWKRYPVIFGVTSPGFEILYKLAGSQTTYVHSHRANKFPPVLLNGLILHKKYDVFVAILNAKSEMPGRFKRIDYIHGTSLFDIPSALDLCYKDYTQTLLPNLFGDKTIEAAKLRMFKFFPIVYTLCSEKLTRLFCSVFFPRFNADVSGLQRPCRSNCEEIHRSCVYAIDRLRFFWPPQMECDKFNDEASCDGLEENPTTSQPRNLEPLDQDEEGLFDGGQNKRSTVGQCQATPANRICAAIIRRQTDNRKFTPVFNVTSNFAAGGTNYFNHTSKDEAIYELSQHLPLLSSIMWENTPQSRNSRPCLIDLLVFLCHLHVPACPVNTRTVTRDQCLQMMNTSTPLSKCHDTIVALQLRNINFKWPPVKVNCFDSKWFYNSTLKNNYDFNGNLPRPPPRNTQLSRRQSTSLLLRFQRQQSSAVVVLYRLNGTITPYNLTYEKTIRRLTPGKDYEVKVASVYSALGFPGPFVTHVNNTYGVCQAETTGENVTQGLFFWRTTRARDIAFLASCPYGYRSTRVSQSENPFRDCICNDVPCKNPVWSKPSTDACNYKTFNNSNVAQELSNLLQSLKNGEKAPVNVSKELVNATTNVTGFQEDSVVLTLVILENIVNSQADLNETGSNIVKTLDNILNVDSNVLADSQMNYKSSTRYLTVLDDYLENVPIQLDGSVSQEEENLAVHVQEFRVKNFQGAGAASLLKGKAEKSFVVYHNDNTVQQSSSQVSLTLPKSLFEALNIRSGDQKRRMNFAIFRKTPFFQSLRRISSRSIDETVRKKNSFVIAGSVKGVRIENLTEPIESTYYPLEKAIDESAACVFWDFKMNNDFGGWSTDGCYYKGTTNGLVTCHCNHLTNFAILMDVYIDDYNLDVHDKALSIISYIGCAVSLLGLILTIITILIFKELRSKSPTQILLNFCIALSLTLIVFLAAAERSKTSSMATCRAAAVALHYFVLVVFAWMAIQAFNMYLAFVTIMPRHRSRFLLKSCIAGWGLPAIVVIVTAVVAIEDYGDEYFCRLRGLPFFVAFLAPGLIILAGNTIAFVLIFRSILTSGKKVAADRKVDNLQQARRGAAILVVLGLTWLFGIFAIKDAKLVFQYLFSIFNAFQGLFVFLFYCVLSSDTRGKYKRLFCNVDKGSESGHHHGTDSRFNEITTSKNTPSYLQTGSTGTSKYGDSMEFQPIQSNQKGSVA